MERPQVAHPVPRTGQPGEQVVHGAGFDWIGLAIERVTGEELEGRAVNTFFWADRTTGIAGALFMQTLPFGEPGAVGTFEAFERAAYAQFAPR